MIAIVSKILRPTYYWHEIESKAPIWKWTFIRLFIPFSILYALTNGVANALFGTLSRTTIWRSFLSLIGTISISFLFVLLETAICRSISGRAGGDASRSVAFRVISYSSIPLLFWSIIEPFLEPIRAYANPLGIAIRAYGLVLLYFGLVVLAKVPGKFPRRVTLTLLIPGIPVGISAAIIGIGTLLKSALSP